MEVFISQLLNLQEKLFRSALFMTQDKTKAKDLLQETFLRILENKDKFRQNNNLSGWANKIMSNIFISDYRKFLIQKRYSDLIITDNDIAYLSEQDFMIRHSISDLMNAIEKLEDKRQTILKLFLAGLKYEEIAQEKDLRIGTVKSQIHQGKEELRKLLK